MKKFNGWLMNQSESPNIAGYQNGQNKRTTTNNA